MSVSRAQREISSPEFAEWMAFAAIEPFGSVREDQRAGAVAATIANVNRDPKHRPEPYDSEDFFPTYETVKDHIAKAIDPDPAPNLSSKLTAWAAAMTQANGRQDVKSTKRPRPPKGKPAKK